MSKQPKKVTKGISSGYWAKVKVPSGGVVWRYYATRKEALKGWDELKALVDKGYYST